MPYWLSLLLALLVILVIAPPVARLGAKHGRRLKGGAMLLLGLGSFYDPPKRHAMEAHQKTEEPGPDSAEPKDRS
jgi:hypothetical protein